MQAAARLEQQTTGVDESGTVPAAVEPAIEASVPEHERVAALAYRFWVERGCPDGSPEEDWFRAERELQMEVAHGE